MKDYITLQKSSARIRDRIWVKRLDARLNLHYHDSWCSLIATEQVLNLQRCGYGLVWPMINEQWWVISSSTVENRLSSVYLPSKASIARVPEQLQWAENSCEPALCVSHRWELKTYYVKPIEILELFITITLTQTYCLYNYEVHSESINPACRRDL